jgi:drug/metabolite transporter (DMT)-like permease
MNSENRGFIYGFLAVFAFGLTLPISKELLQYSHPIFIALSRSIIAGFFASVFLLIWGKDLPTLKQFTQICIIALGVVIGFPIFSTISMETISASHGAIMMGILPLTTAISGVIFTKEKPSKLFWIFGIVGSGLVISYSLLENHGSFKVGDFYLIIAIVLVSIGYALGGKLAKEISGWKVMSWALVVSFPFLIVPTLLYLPSDIWAMPYSGYMYFLYLGIVSQLFAFFAWYKGLALGGIARVSQVQLMQTFVTLFASSIILDEKISVLMITFTLLIVIVVGIGKKMPIN